MDSKENKGDFIDFIIAANKGKKLAEDFLAIAAAEEPTAEALFDFFEKKYDISREECDRILDAVNSGIGKGISKGGDPVIWDPIGTKSY